MTFDDAMQSSLTQIVVEVFNPESPFGGVLVEGAVDKPLQVELNSGSPVSSVFGRVGSIVAQCSDYAGCYCPNDRGVPPGGTVAQVLTKFSDADFAADWEDATGGGGGSGSLNATPYRFSSSVASADPGSGKLRFDSATPASIANIYIDNLNDSGVDISSYLALLKKGDVVAIQDKDNSGNAFRFDVLSNPVNNTGWWTIPVSLDRSQGTLPANNSQIIFMAQMQFPSSNYVLKQPGFPTPATLNQVIACLQAAGLCA